MKQTRLLLILDGFGYSENNFKNAINNANTPNWDKTWANNPHTLLQASSFDVGLPEGQMGNSEVGHVNIGAGRIIYQDLTKIDKEIKEGTFGNNEVLKDVINYIVDNDKAMHIMGLLSPGGVHSHEAHIASLVQIAHASGVKKIFVHAFLDGRDVPPRSAQESIENMDKLLAELGAGYIASISGRYYAMDRDNRWERVQLAYDVITTGESDIVANSALEGLEKAYTRDESDEFVLPTAILKDGKSIKVEDGDSIVFMNFRADRAREIAHAFTDEKIDGFVRKSHPKTKFVTLTQYDSTLECDVMFPPEQPRNTLGEVLANNHLTQLRIAETEEYPHVTFFFNGGEEKEFEGEDRILVSSPKVATYDMQPEMSANEVKEKLVAAIDNHKYDCIICNFANADMVGHTGNYDAAIQAIEFLDGCVCEVKDAIVRNNGEMFITADHGNADMMENATTHKAHTAHTTNPVPFVYIGEKQAEVIKNDGKLSDIVPTMLNLMNIEQPVEMTGKPVFKFKK